MGQRSFIIIVIIGSILIGIAVAANYCQLCRNHVACRPKRGFGAKCGKQRTVVRLNASYQKQILQIHDGLRSLVASGLVTGYPPAKRMCHLKWDPELAKIAAINARQCYVHYDKCTKTAKFPWTGQNVGIDRANGGYHATNQSIYRITLKWFRQFELGNADAMNSYRSPKNRKKRFNNFAKMVHDRQTSVGCAAVRFRKKKNYYTYLVCNYSMRVMKNRKVYSSGTPYTGCTSGRSMDYPSLCSKKERIKAIPYPVSRARPGVSRKVNPLSFFGINSNSLGAIPASNAANFRTNRTSQLAGGRRKNQSRGRKKTSGARNSRRSKKNRRKNKRSKRNKTSSSNRRSTAGSKRRRTTRRNQTEIQNQPNFPNPFSFLFG